MDDGGHDNTCFVICPIDKPETEIRKRSDQLLRHIIEPAAAKAGLEAVRSDKIEETSLITNQIVEHIVSDKVVVADLTGWNPNVFYELALRHATQMPYVQLIKHGETLPFDVSNVNTIFYDLSDPDAVEEVKEKLTNYISAAMAPDAQIVSPFSQAIRLMRLFDSGDQGKVDYANLVSEVGDLRQEFREFRSSLARNAPTAEEGVRRSLRFSRKPVDAVVAIPADALEGHPDTETLLMYLADALDVSHDQIKSVAIDRDWAEVTTRNGQKQIVGLVPQPVERAVPERLPVRTLPKSRGKD